LEIISDPHGGGSDRSIKPDLELEASTGGAPTRSGVSEKRDSFIAEDMENPRTEEAVTENAGIFSVTTEDRDTESRWETVRTVTTTIGGVCLVAAPVAGLGYYFLG